MDDMLEMFSGEMKRDDNMSENDNCMDTEKFTDENTAFEQRA